MSKIIKKDELKELQVKHDKEFKALQASLYKLINKSAKGDKIDKDEVSSLKTLLETLKISQQNELDTFKRNKRQEPAHTKDFKDEKNKGGRPTDYNLDLAREICEKIATSGKNPLKWICEQNPHFPNRTTILKWAVKHKEFSDMYGEAYALKQDNLYDDMIETALNSSPDRVMCDRLIVDTLKFGLVKLSPRKYGDRANEENNANNINEVLNKLIDKLPS